METKPDKIKNENNKVFKITVRFNKIQYEALTQAFLKTRTYMGIIARQATLEYLKNHYGITVPDDEQKTS